MVKGRLIDSRHLPDFTPEHLRVEPLALAKTIPSSWYTHPAFHDLADSREDLYSLDDGEPFVDAR